MLFLKNRTFICIYQKKIVPLSSKNLYFIPMKRLVPIITYVILTINTLYIFLFCLLFCFYEVDLFLPIWISSLIAIYTIPVGLGLSIYALFQKDNPILRGLGLIQVKLYSIFWYYDI